LQLFDGFQFLLTELIGSTPDVDGDDLELMQKKIDADLSEIVKRILAQNTDVVADGGVDQIDFATFLEIYVAMVDYKSSSNLNSHSIPTSPTTACNNTEKSKRKDFENGDEKSKKVQKKNVL